MAREKMKECPCCGKFFRTTRQFKKYCSPECREKFTKEKEFLFQEKVCAFCGKSFIVTKFREKQRFCSQRCYYDSIENKDNEEEKVKREEHKEKLVTTTCIKCGSEFKTSKGKKVCRLCKEIE